MGYGFKPLCGGVMQNLWYTTKIGNVSLPEKLKNNKTCCQCHIHRYIKKASEHSSLNLELLKELPKNHKGSK